VRCACRNLTAGDYALRLTSNGVDFSNELRFPVFVEPTLESVSPRAVRRGAAAITLSASSLDPVFDPVCAFDEQLRQGLMLNTTHFTCSTPVAFPLEQNATRVRVSFDGGLSFLPATADLVVYGES
jgi:hypothetical protein